MKYPRVTDDDDSNISLTHCGKEIRSFYYESEDQRRMKMLMAREYVEGFGDGYDHMDTTLM